MPETKTESAGIYSYYPEMGDKKPNTKIEASLAHYGKHYFLKTELELKTGRSIKFIDQTTSRDGKARNNYKVTIRAFEQLKKEYSIGFEMLLD